MWYVLQVRTGTEENIRTQCRNNIPEAVLTRCFIPYYEEKRRIRGTWTVVRKVLFPGYVFAVTDRPDDLGLTKLLGTGQEIVPLTEEEKNFLEELGGREQIVAMSEGIIEGDQVIVTKGPLKGKEGMIRKIDRHKRKVWLEVKMFGKMQRVEAGLEIVVKNTGIEEEKEIR